MLASGTYTVGSGNFYDSGGPNLNYMSNQSTITTLKPLNNNQKINVAFNTFATESNSDILYIYNGTNTNSTPIGTYSGNTSPGNITSSSSDGCLTFKFVSSQYNNYTGWSGIISNVAK